MSGAREGVSTSAAAYLRRSESCQAAVSSSRVLPVISSKRFRTSRFARRARAGKSAPYSSTKCDQTAAPQRYGKYRGDDRSLMDGRMPEATASRIHIAVWGSSAPSVRYSAIPSRNQSGTASVLRCWSAMSNWNAWTIS